MNKRKKNYDIYAGFPFYTPGFSGCLVLLLLFLGGTLLGSCLSAVFMLIYSTDIAMEYVSVISYPVMFIPAMIYASIQSKRGSFFNVGYRLDSNNFGSMGLWGAIGLSTLLAIAASIVLDITGYVLPEMPAFLKDALDSMTKGNFWVDFLCVSIFAPFFEEWLCRGEILRGLLNFKRKDGSNGIRPVWAITGSAAFFALIHANLWQAIPAFGIGCLMGYVYYKTGSLKLTMVMHFVNNTLALVLSQIDAFGDAEFFIEIMGAKWYWLAFAASAMLLFLIIRKFSTIECQRPQGGSDVLDPSDI